MALDMAQTQKVVLDLVATAHTVNRSNPFRADRIESTVGKVKNAIEQKTGRRISEVRRGDDAVNIVLAAPQHQRAESIEVTKDAICARKGIPVS